jgi:hypothetical protein
MLEELRGKVDIQVLRRVGESLGMSPAEFTAFERGEELPVDGAALASPDSRPTEPGTDLAFIVFGTNQFRARQVFNYLAVRLNFKRVALASDVKELARCILATLNDPEVTSAAFAVSADICTDFKRLLRSDSLQSLRDKLPRMLDLPVFALVPPTAEGVLPDSIDASLALDMNQSNEFNEMRIRRAMM